MLRNNKTKSIGSWNSKDIDLPQWVMSMGKRARDVLKLTTIMKITA